MSTKINVNVNQICSIHLFLKKRVHRFEYVTGKNYWPFFHTKAGYVDNHGLNNPKYTEEEVLKNFNNIRIENYVVYENPHVYCLMSNRERFYKFFKTEVEATSFYYEILMMLQTKEFDY